MRKIAAVFAGLVAGVTRETWIEDGMVWRTVTVTSGDGGVLWQATYEGAQR